jgi:hypothetical protein
MNVRVPGSKVSVGRRSRRFGCVYVPLRVLRHAAVVWTRFEELMKTLQAAPKSAVGARPRLAFPSEGVANANGDTDWRRGKGCTCPAVTAWLDLDRGATRWQRLGAIEDAVSNAGSSSSSASLAGIVVLRMWCSPSTADLGEAGRAPPCSMPAPCAVSDDIASDVARWTSQSLNRLFGARSNWCVGRLFVDTAIAGQSSDSLAS